MRSNLCLASTFEREEALSRRFFSRLMKVPIGAG